MDNGIPIIPFINDEDDNQLLRLAEYLPLLASKDDVWYTLKRNFKLWELYDMRETFTIYNEDEEEEFNMDSHLDNLQTMFWR